MLEKTDKLKPYHHHGPQRDWQSRLMHIMSAICPINQGNNLFHETSISDLHPVEQTNKYIQGGSAHLYNLIRPVELSRAFWQSYFSGERGNPIPEVTILTMCNQVWLSCECSLGKPRNSPPLITFQSYCGSIFSPQDPSRIGEINQDNELIFLPQFFFEQQEVGLYAHNFALMRHLSICQCKTG